MLIEFPISKQKCSLNLLSLAICKRVAITFIQVYTYWLHVNLKYKHYVYIYWNVWFEYCLNWTYFQLTLAVAASFPCFYPIFYFINEYRQTKYVLSRISCKLILDLQTIGTICSQLVSRLVTDIKLNMCLGYIDY